MSGFTKSIQFKNTLYLIFIVLVSQISTFSFADSSNKEPKSAHQTHNKWISDWEPERSEGNVHGTCRTHVSNIKQCKFITESDVPVAALSAVIMDVNRFKDWAVSVLSSDQVVYSEHDKDIYVYTTYHFTGAYNRDAVSRYRKTEFSELKTTKIDFITVDKPVEKKDLRLVRFPLMAGYWQFKEKDNGKTEIELLTFSLPGGMVQNVLYSLFNIGFIDASFETMRIIQKQASLPEYMAKVSK